MLLLLGWCFQGNTNTTTQGNSESDWNSEGNAAIIEAWNLKDDATITTQRASHVNQGCDRSNLMSSLLDINSRVLAAEYAGG